MNTKEFLSNQRVEDVLMAVMDDKAVFSDKKAMFHITVPFAREELDGVKQEGSVDAFLADFKEAIWAFDSAAEAEHKLEQPSGLETETCALSEACEFKQDIACVYGTLRRTYEKSLLTEEEWARLSLYRSKHMTGEIKTVYDSLEEFMETKGLNLEDTVKTLVLSRKYCTVCNRILEFSSRD